MPGGVDCTARKWWGPVPLSSWNARWAPTCCTSVENHWRQTPAYKELEFRWVPEDVTRLATLLSGEVHISDVPRALQKDARPRA